MANTANPSVPEHGEVRRALAAIWATLEAMSSSSGFDYTLDRIERLEREVSHLTQELRQIRNTGAVDSNNDNVAGREH